MTTPRHPTRLPRQSRGFTLIELMVVTLIIVLLSAAMIPVVVPAVNERRVSSAANLIHAELNRARDAAVRANAPRGIRLLPDEFDSSRPLVLTSSRIVSIRPGPDYSEGKVTSVEAAGHPLPEYLVNLGIYPAMVVKEHKVDIVNGGTQVPTNPTSWFWNIRQGDQIQLGDSSRRYTIIGPMLIDDYRENPQRFINHGPLLPPPNGWLSTPGSDNAEFLVLVDGEDSDGDGFTDEPDEFEWKRIHEDIPRDAGINYKIYRRPVPTEDGREITLPAGTVIDLTTWNTPHPERSQLPVDPLTGYVDIMIAPNGQVIQSAASSNVASPGEMPYFHMSSYFHFWITDVEDVHNPLWGPTTPSPDHPNSAFPMQSPNANPRHGVAGCPESFLLPMPSEVSTQIGGCGGSYPPTDLPSAPFLTANRRLVSLNTMSGQVITSKAENFSIFNTNRPYQDALGGYGESP